MCTNTSEIFCSTFIPYIDCFITRSVGLAVAASAFMCNIPLCLYYFSHLIMFQPENRFYFQLNLIQKAIEFSNFSTVSPFCAVKSLFSPKCWNIDFNDILNCS